MNSYSECGISSAGKIIKKFVDKINPEVEPVLRELIPAVYVDCLKIALTEGVSADDRRKQISEKLIVELEPGLTRGLDKRVDFALVPDMWEDDLFRLVSKKIIKEFVEWTIGELDTKLARELALPVQQE